VSVVAGALLILCSLGPLGAGGAALWADTAARDGGGYVNASSETYRTSGYAVASDTVDLHWNGGWYSARSLFGTIRPAGHPHQARVQLAGPIGGVRTDLTR
jgi:hypothetical protein